MRVSCRSLVAATVLVGAAIGGVVFASAENIAGWRSIIFTTYPCKAFGQVNVIAETEGSGWNWKLKTLRIRHHDAELHVPAQALDAAKNPMLNTLRVSTGGEGDAHPRLYASIVLARSKPGKEWSFPRVYFAFQDDRFVKTFSADTNFELQRRVDSEEEILLWRSCTITTQAHGTIPPHETVVAAEVEGEGQSQKLKTFRIRHGDRELRIPGNGLEAARNPMLHTLQVGGERGYGKYPWLYVSVALDQPGKKTEIGFPRIYFAFQNNRFVKRFTATPRQGGGRTFSDDWAPAVSGETVQYAWWYCTWLFTALFLAWCVRTCRTAVARRWTSTEESSRGGRDSAAGAHSDDQGFSRRNTLAGLAGPPAAILWVLGLGGYCGLARLILSPRTVGIMVATPVVLVAAFYALSDSKSQRNRRLRVAGWAGMAVGILLLVLYPLVSGLN